MSKFSQLRLFLEPEDKYQPLQQEITELTDPMEQETKDILPVVLKNSMNAPHFSQQGEQNNQASMTVPDQTMPIREILDRYARGLPLDNLKTPVYNGEDDDFPDLSKMDLADREQYIMDRQQELKEINERLSLEKNKMEAEKKKEQEAQRKRERQLQRLIEKEATQDDEEK